MSDVERRLIPVERRRQIVQLVEDLHVVRTDELATRFAVGEETIRRDLTLLEQQRVLTREHGGAALVVGDIAPPHYRRERTQRNEKRRIAQAAAVLIRDGSTIIIDSGTTTHYLVQLLQSKKDLVVITNAIDHAADLLVNPTISVVIAGGAVRSASMGTAGDLAVATLEKLHADHVFLATHGFSVEHGVTYPNIEEAAVKRAMMAAAAEVTLLADGTKYGRTAMVRVATLRELDRIITTGPIPEEEIAKMRDLGVEVIVLNAADSLPGGSVERDELRSERE